MNNNITVVVILLTICTICAQTATVGKSWYEFSLVDLKWSGSDVAFLLTTDQSLYRSDNEGYKWEAQATKLPGNQSYPIGGMEMDVVDDKKLIFYVRTAYIAWTTTDAGKTYTKVQIPDIVYRIEPHPTNTGWLLLVGANSVFVSQDFAQSWRVVNRAGAILYDDINDIQWGNDADSPQHIYTILDEAFSYLPNFDSAPQKIFPQRAYGYVWTTKHLYVGLDDGKGQMSLMVATDVHKGISGFKQAHFSSTEVLQSARYHFLDDSTGAEWIGITDYTGISGDLIVSGVDGLKYTSSLENVYANQEYDFAPIQGIEGLYIANVVANFPQTRPSAVQLVTKITFDNGGEWKSLTPPAGTVCTEACSLHLHGIGSYYDDIAPPFYSTPNSLGLIIGVGNVGAYLSTGDGSVDTYLSRDAGLTWEMIQKGNYIYEVGNHGGIIVMGLKSGPTNGIKYSLDQGLTFVSLPFPDSLPAYLNIKNIVSNSDMSHRFLVYAARDQREYTIGLDFSQFQNRSCESADFELWAPSDGRANITCQLGRNTTYARRSRAADCDAHATEKVVSTVHCACSLEDYQCDLGYRYDGNVQTCVLDGATNVYPPVDCRPGETYEVTKGWRLVAGDSCVNELPQFAKEIKQCPGSAPSKPSHVGVIVGVTLSVVAVIAVVAIVLYKNDKWRESALAFVGVHSQSARYSRLGGGANSSLADEEFGIGGDHDLDDSDVEDDAPVLQDTDIIQATKGDNQ